MAKTRYFNVEVTRRDHDDENKLIKRFIKKVQRSKFLVAYVETLRYKKQSEIRNEAKRKTKRRLRKEKFERENNTKSEEQ
jgi:hypothetical protein